MKNDNTLDEVAKKEIAKHISCDESKRIHDLADRMFRAGASFREKQILDILQSEDIKDLTDEYGWMSLTEIIRFIEETLKEKI